MAIELNEASFSYSIGGNEQIKALAPTTLAIQPGESVALVGANGSGKSTLAKIMNGLLTPTTGSVSIDGLDTAKREEAVQVHRMVGMVFQNPENQIVATIVEDDVAFGPENCGLPPADIRIRVDESLKAVGMHEYRRHDPNCLSAGQRQKIAIAGILALEPRYMIMDEPTSRLDPRGCREVAKILEKLRKERGIAVVLITHVVEAAAKADRVIMLREGSVIADGEPRALLTDELLMAEAGLSTTLATRLACRLAANGVSISPALITAEEVGEALCLLG